MVQRHYIQRWQHREAPTAGTLGLSPDLSSSSSTNSTAPLSDPLAILCPSDCFASQGHGNYSYAVQLSARSSQPLFHIWVHFTHNTDCSTNGAGDAGAPARLAAAGSASHVRVSLAEHAAKRAQQPEESSLHAPHPRRETVESLLLTFCTGQAWLPCAANLDCMRGGRGEAWTAEEGELTVCVCAGSHRQTASSRSLPHRTPFTR